MRKHRIEIRSLCVLQKVSPRDFDTDDEVKARKDVWEMTARERYVSIFYVNPCFYFNCIVDPNLKIDPSIRRKWILSMLTKCQNMMSFSGFVRSTRRRKFSTMFWYHTIAHEEFYLVGETRIDSMRKTFNLLRYYV